MRCPHSVISPNAPHPSAAQCRQQGERKGQKSDGGNHRGAWAGVCRHAGNPNTYKAGDSHHGQGDARCRFRQTRGEQERSHVGEQREVGKQQKWPRDGHSDHAGQFHCRTEGRSLLAGLVMRAREKPERQNCQERAHSGKDQERGPPRHE